MKKQCSTPLLPVNTFTLETSDSSVNFPQYKHRTASKMEDTVDFFCWKVPDLKKYLQARGIQCSFGRKIELVRLCELADELKLKVCSFKLNEIFLNELNNDNLFDF